MRWSLRYPLGRREEGKGMGPPLPAAPLVMDHGRRLPEASSHTIGRYSTFWWMLVVITSFITWPKLQHEERYGRFSYAAITSAILAIFLVYGLFFMPLYAINPDYPYWVDNIRFLLIFIGWVLGFVAMFLGTMANKRREKLGRLSIWLGLFVVCAPAILIIVMFIAWLFTWPPQ
jgi:hypothetical protein